MAERETARLDLADLLAGVENASPVAAGDVLGERLTAVLGASEVSFLVVEFSGHALRRLGQHAGEVAASNRPWDDSEGRVEIEGTPHGRALANQAVEIERSAAGARLFAPVTNRGEAIGVLELNLPEAPDEQALADVALAAHALAYVIIANRRFTDLFEWGQRSVPLSLAAEIQHRLLPGSYTCEAGQFTLAAWLEPSGDIAGDTFDFALDRTTLHLSMTDAMGHAVNASVLATVLVGGLRNARRAGAGLGEQVRRASEGLGAHAGWGEFVTGQVVRVDLEAEVATIVNAGHPPPLRLRDGRVEAVPLEADPPFGTVQDFAYRVQPLPLEPGDRLVFLTDGMTERNADPVDIEALVAEGGGLHPREAVQALTRAVLEATDGELKDDATVMCLDWHGGRPRERSTDAGADE
jgi:serine phosphatase RsbU (regulator of sigma subunit)